MLWAPGQAHPAAALATSDVGAPYHSHHHPDQGDEEERPQHIAHHGVAVGLGGIGHCRVTHDISSQMAGWSAWAMVASGGRLPWAPWGGGREVTICTLW